jgi:hypothetical protein
VLVAGGDDDRPLERRLVCMLRTIRSEPAVPAYAPARFPARHSPLG